MPVKKNIVEAYLYKRKRKKTIYKKAYGKAKAKAKHKKIKSTAADLREKAQTKAHKRYGRTRAEIKVDNKKRLKKVGKSLKTARKYTRGMGGSADSILGEVSKGSGKKGKSIDDLLDIKI